MIYEFIIILLIAIDQISKLLVLNYLKEIGSLPIIQNVFHFTYVENRGAAFGMFQNNQILFINCSTYSVYIWIILFAYEKGRYSWKNWNTSYNIWCFG